MSIGWLSHKTGRAPTLDEQRGVLHVPNNSEPPKAWREPAGDDLDDLDEAETVAAAFDEQRRAPPDLLARCCPASRFSR
jgi:hypothetical protein